MRDIAVSTWMTSYRRLIWAGRAIRMENSRKSFKILASNHSGMEGSIRMDFRSKSTLYELENFLRI